MILTETLATIAIAVISSWITVQLSLSKFRSERWWEKKVEAYERIIEAFHNSKKFASEHMSAEEEGREVSEVRTVELRKLAREARDEILKASDMGSFILSEKALKILARYKSESENISRQQSWHDCLADGWSIADRHMKEFIAEARRDLKKRNITMKLLT